jgi:hypothetical protein
MNVAAAGDVQRMEYRRVGRVLRVDRYVAGEQFSLDPQIAVVAGRQGDGVSRLDGRKRSVQLSCVTDSNNRHKKPLVVR